MLQERYAREATILRRVGCLPTFRMREVASGTLALAKAKYGVELADVASRDMARLELATVRALVGTHAHLTGEGGAVGGLGAGAPGLPSVAPPVFESIVACPPGTHARSRTGAGPGNTAGNRPPAGHGANGQGPAIGLRGEAVRGWLVWHVPGQCEQLHLVLACFGEVCHRMRESQRYTALAALERRRPATFGGLGAEVCKLACTLGMTLASSETERSLLPALQAGLTWTGVRVRKHQISDSATCPYCCPPPPPGGGGPSPVGLPAVANTAGRLAPAGAS